MKVLVPIKVDNSVFSASNVAENDYPIWDNTTTYAQGARVLIAGTIHKVYESRIAGNQGKNPLTDEASWLYVGASNRWKAFDERLNDPTVNAGSITYTLISPGVADGIAFFKLVGKSVRVRVLSNDPTPVVVFDKKKDLVYQDNIADWFDYFYEDIEFDDEAIFTAVTILTGYSIEITIAVDSGNAQVGQITFGRVRDLGSAVTPGTGIGIKDYSRKERDEFGNVSIVERDFVSTANFMFVAMSGNENRLKRILTPLRAKPAVYFLGEDAAQYGATVYGHYESFYVQMSFKGLDNISLSVEGLV